MDDYRFDPYHYRCNLERSWILKFCPECIEQRHLKSFLKFGSFFSTILIF